MRDKTLSILSLLLLQIASTMLLVRPAGAALVWGTVVDTTGAPVVDATVEFAPMGDTTQVFSAPTGADGSYSILLEPLSSAVEEGGTPHRPEAFQLLQNYPNPFNPATLIHYILAAPGAVELAIYNVLGHKVRTLVDTYQEAGRYSVEWDGRDGRGRGLSAGVYIYRLRAGAFAASTKMTLLDGAAKAPATTPLRAARPALSAPDAEERYRATVRGAIEPFAILAQGGRLLDFVEVSIPADGRLDFIVVRPVDENVEGPQERTIEVYKGEDEHGEKVEYQFYRSENELVKHGYYKRFWNEEQIKSAGNYTNGYEDGKWIEYFRDGNISVKGNYKEGVKDGEWVSYDPDPSAEAKDVQNYKDGKKHGWCANYYDGHITSEGYWKEGKRHGVFTHYSDLHGDTLYIDTYEEGIQHGWSIEFGMNGSKSGEGNYENGEKDGPWVYYHYEGEIRRKGNYKNGKEDGKWTYYDEEGEITGESCYELGKEVACP